MTNPTLLQAHELDEYFYCRRKWWYVLCGFKSQKQDLLTAGTINHQNISNRLDFSQNSRRIGIILIGAGLLGLSLIIIFLIKFILKI